MNLNNLKQSYTPSTYYPYGELPLKYTKQGQEQLKRNLESKNTKAFENYNNYIDQQTKQTDSVVETQSTNNNTTINNLDINTLLPLLSSLGGNSGDMIKKMLPLINNGGNLQINDLLKLFSNFSKTSSNNQSILKNIDSGTEIDNLIKVD